MRSYLPSTQTAFPIEFVGARGFGAARSITYSNAQPGSANNLSVLDWPASGAQLARRKAFGERVMHPDKTAIERAFDLARSGSCRTVMELVTRLDREGYDGRQIHGRVLRKQLAHLIEERKIAHAQQQISK